MDNSISRNTAIKFVILLGLVSLLGDMTYEGARSITGPYLAILGASATVVGVVAGFGELIGYGLRLVFGYLSDRTGRYWTITLVGYAVNLLAVPLLALAGRWEVAALLMIAERLGKAIRTPARDAMLSHATHQTGRGWGFGLHEAMDQVGAVLGPLIVAAVLYWRGDYQVGFGVLLVPALLALTVLVVARLLYPRPRELEIGAPQLYTQGFPRIFWLYLAGVALIAAGYADFPLIAYHFERVAIAVPPWIPVLYAAAMAVDALAALLFGRWFDQRGLPVLAAAALLSAFFAPLVFWGGFGLALAGMVVWGIGMGAQESVMRAAVGGMTSPDKRGTAYGLFNTGFGVFWFGGSVLMGLLYDVSLPALVVFSVVTQLAAALLLWGLSKSSGQYKALS
ncbi:MAG: hypothetical protein FOGNACKC_06088 [Anaerolineae bacterium]|nr:hypothetical protein [Anaerolineae bacterium]